MHSRSTGAAPESLLAWVTDVFPVFVLPTPRRDPGDPPRGRSPQAGPGRRPRHRDPARDGLALQPVLQRQPCRRRCAVARRHLRLGRRGPVLRAQRLPRRPARPARAPADRPLRQLAVLRPPRAQAVAGPLRLPGRLRLRRVRAVAVLLLAERAARAELRRDVADPPVVARRRGTLLPRPGAALPAARAAPDVTKGAGRRARRAAGHRARPALGRRPLRPE